MALFISFAILFIAVSYVVTKQPWHCDISGVYKCPEDQTCCRSTTTTIGWACFEEKNAVCCQDGKRTCPEKTTCNLKENNCNNQRGLRYLYAENISKKHLRFLEPAIDKVFKTEINAITSYIQESKIQKIIRQLTSEIVDDVHPNENLPLLCTPIDYTTEDDEQIEVINDSATGYSTIESPFSFAYGFMDGLVIFKDFSDPRKCSPTQPALLQYVGCIVNYIRDRSNNNSLPLNLRYISTNLIYFFNRLSILSPECEEFVKDVNKFSSYIMKHFTDKVFWPKLTIHILDIFFDEINTKFKEGLAALQEKKYEAAGNIFGDLVRSVIIWDLNSNIQGVATRIAVAIVGPQPSIDFDTGFYSNFFLFKDISLNNQCCFEAPFLTKDTQEMLNLISQLQIKNLPEILIDILKILTRIYEYIEETSSYCQTPIKGSESLADKLHDIISSDGYMIKIVKNLFNQMMTIKHMLLDIIKYDKINNLVAAGKKFADLLNLIFFLEIPNLN